MTTETDVKQRLAILRGVLAKATKGCDKGSPQCHLGSPEIYTHWPDCICQGTGEVAMFPDFRQVCEDCEGTGEIQVTARDARGYRLLDVDGIPYLVTAKCYDPEVEGLGTEGCGGRSWQVRAGGMADGLAGLSVLDALDVLRGLSQWVWQMDDGPMPDADSIDLKALELVCEVKGLSSESD